ALSAHSGDPQKYVAVSALPPSASLALSTADLTSERSFVSSVSSVSKASNAERSAKRSSTRLPGPPPRNGIDDELPTLENAPPSETFPVRPDMVSLAPIRLSMTFEPPAASATCADERMRTR